MIELNAIRRKVAAVEWYLFTGNVAEAERFADGDLDLTDEAASHMANGREAEARQAVGL